MRIDEVESCDTRLKADSTEVIISLVGIRVGAGAKFKLAQDSLLRVTDLFRRQVNNASFVIAVQLVS